MGYEIPYPEGAFYMFPKAPSGDDIAFVNKLKQKRVLVVPGSGFGNPSHFRISYCVNETKIKNALPLFKEAINEIRNG
jgi:aspartate aminotransferase